jgi:drug/metabolite transporter (DMT)-like permease
MNRSAEGKTMKRIFLVSVCALVPVVAAAHPSIMPHDHPHATSMLPDIAALLMAAIVVGAGAMFIAISKRQRNDPR